MKKGDPLYVGGRLWYRTFRHEEGKERGVCENITSSGRHRLQVVLLKITPQLYGYWIDQGPR